MARYWVGGATGFLGSHLVRALHAAGHEVRAVSRRGGAVGPVRVDAVDVLDTARVTETARGADGAFLAVGKVSRDPADAEELHRSHVFGTRSALAGLRAAGVKRVVVASTSGTIAVGTDPMAIYDELDSPPLEHIAKWPYYRSKYYAELEALEANQPPDFEVVVVNPSLLLGPGDVGNSSTEDVRKFLDGEILAVPRGGIAFVDVRDAADAMVSAMTRGRAGERYLLNAVNFTVAEFFQKLERVSGVPSPRLPLPKSRTLAVEGTKLFLKAVKAIGGEPPVEAESIELAAYYWYANAAKATAELGFDPRDPIATLRDTAEDLVMRGAAHPRTGKWGEDERAGAGWAPAIEGPAE